MESMCCRARKSETKRNAKKNATQKCVSAADHTHMRPRREGPVISEQREQHLMAANMLLASRSIRSRRRAAASFGGKGGRIRNHGANLNCTGGRIKLQPLAPCAAAPGVHHEALNLSGGERVRDAFHIQTVNNGHSRLKDFLRRCRGVATKYPDNCLRWFQRPEPEHASPAPASQPQSEIHAYVL